MTTFLVIHTNTLSELPHEFTTAPKAVYNADLLIVMGTSLTVHPFASLASMDGPTGRRVLINLDLVGDFSDSEDLVLLGKCDDVVKDLCRALGWEKELNQLWEDTAASLELETGDATGEKDSESDLRDVQEEVESLTNMIQAAMGLHGRAAEDGEEGEEEPGEPEERVEEASKSVQEETEEGGSTRKNPALPIQGAPLDDFIVRPKAESSQASANGKSDGDKENKEGL